MSISIIKFIHITLSISFLGLQVSSYYYLSTAIKERTVKLIDYSLRNTLMVDAVLFFVVIAMFSTCAYLVFHEPGFSFQIPWVHAACVYLSVVFILFLVNMLIKYVNLQKINRGVFEIFRYKYVLHGNYILIIVGLIIIIHDAVMRSTWFSLFSA